MGVEAPSDNIAALLSALIFQKAACGSEQFAGMPMPPISERRFAAFAHGKPEPIGVPPTIGC
jgi:hypothetical protein